MDERPTVGVKYCGGCNPRYDRVALVQQLAAAFPRLSFSHARPEEPGDILLVVCGCSARCADLTGLEGRPFHICGSGDLKAEEVFLREFLEEVSP